MDKKEIVKYVTYVAGGVALVSLVTVAPLQSIVLGICALANIAYVNR